MFKRVITAAVGVFVLLASQISPASAATTVTMVGSVTESLTRLPNDLSAIATLPNGRVVALTTNWNSASLIANRVDGVNASTTYLFEAGNRDGQNPSRFAWKVAPNGRLYVLFTTYTKPVGAGFATAGVRLRSTSDGQTWSAPINVFPDYSVGFACTPATQICGYLQPGLEVAPNGTMLATVMKTTTSSRMAFDSRVSTNGSAWTEPANLNVSFKFSNSEDNLTYFYSRSSYLQLTKTDNSFAILYPFVLPPVAPVIFGDYGMASATLPFANLQSWQDPVNAQYIPVKDRNAAGSMALGPYLAFSSGKLTALWIDRFSNGDMKLAVTRFDASSRTWSAPTQTQVCISCIVSNDIVRQQDRLIVTASHITLPLVLEPATFQGSSGKSLMTFTIKSDMSVQPIAIVTNLSRDKQVKLHGAFEDAAGTLTFLVREDLATFELKHAKGRSVITKIKNLAPSASATDFSMTAVQSSNGSVHILNREFTTMTDPTRVGTVYDYYRTITTTKPKFFGAILVSGRAKVGQYLKLSKAYFDEASGKPALSYQWMRCSSEIAMPGLKLPKGCVLISKATRPDYKSVSADTSKYILARITATNAAGSTIFYSDSTSKVVR
jgi:hypothetical protein